MEKPSVTSAPLHLPSSPYCIPRSTLLHFRQLLCASHVQQRPLLRGRQAGRDDGPEKCVSWSREHPRWLRSVMVSVFF